MTVADFTVLPKIILHARGGYWVYDDPFFGEDLFPSAFRQTLDTPRCDLVNRRL